MTDGMIPSDGHKHWRAVNFEDTWGSIYEVNTCQIKAAVFSLPATLFSAHFSYAFKFFALQKGPNSPPKTQNRRFTSSKTLQPSKYGHSIFLFPKYPAFFDLK
jgi:hypothetical protein